MVTVTQIQERLKLKRNGFLKLDAMEKTLDGLIGSAEHHIGFMMESLIPLYNESQTHEVIRRRNRNCSAFLC